MARALTLVALIAAACASRTVGEGGSEEPAPAVSKRSDAGSGGGAAESVQRTTHLALELSEVEERREPPRTRVFVDVTDETGARDREEIGVFEGECTEVSGQLEGEPMDPILGADCWHEDQGVKLRFVVRDWVLIVLRARVYSKDEDPYYDEHQRIELTKGSRVVTDFD